MSDEIFEVLTPFADVAELGQGFVERADGERILLALPQACEHGDGVRFIVHLADGTPAFAGAGRCVQVSDQGPDAPAAQRFETLLDSLAFDERSRPVYDYIVAVRQMAYSEVAEGAAAVGEEAVYESEEDAAAWSAEVVNVEVGASGESAHPQASESSESELTAADVSVADSEPAVAVVAETDPGTPIDAAFDAPNEERTDASTEGGADAALDAAFDASMASMAGAAQASIEGEMDVGATGASADAVAGVEDSVAAVASVEEAPAVLPPPAPVFEAPAPVMDSDQPALLIEAQVSEQLSPEVLASVIPEPLPKGMLQRPAIAAHWAPASPRPPRPSTRPSRFRHAGGKLPAPDAPPRPQLDPSQQIQPAPRP